MITRPDEETQFRVQISVALAYWALIVHRLGILMIEYVVVMGTIYSSRSTRQSDPTDLLRRH